MSKSTYKKAGVDIDKADAFVRGIKKFVTVSQKDAVAAFGSMFDLKSFLRPGGHPVLVSSTDGVGTKLLLAQKLGIHNTVGIDLVAMNVNDISCLGARPLFFLDYIACGALKPSVLKEVVYGIHRGLQQSGCALLGGETAEMPGMYKPNEYDLAGFCVGIVDKHKRIDGKKIVHGDVVIGVESSGFHSNGFSLVRNVLSMNDIKKHARKVLEPTRIYVQQIQRLLQSKRVGDHVSGIAHITGGAFYNKATKILPKGYGMVIDRKSWRVPQVFTMVQRKGSIDDVEMYSVFNMGIGLMVIVKKKALMSALRILNQFYPSHIIGEVIKSKERMTLI